MATKIPRLNTGPKCPPMDDPSVQTPKPFAKSGPSDKAPDCFVPPAVALVLPAHIEKDQHQEGQTTCIHAHLWREAVAPFQPQVMTPRQASAAWCAKQITALVTPTHRPPRQLANHKINDDKNTNPRVTIQTWNTTTTLSLPCIMWAIHDLLAQDQRHAHIRFCGHGLCQEVLIDPLGQRFPLRPKEAALAAFLFAHPHTRRDAVLQQVWRYDATAETETIEVHLSSLRHILQATSHPLQLSSSGGSIILESTVSWQVSDSSQTLSVS